MNDQELITINPFEVEIQNEWLLTLVNAKDVCKVTFSRSANTLKTAFTQQQFMHVGSTVLCVCLIQDLIPDLMLE